METFYIILVLYFALIFIHGAYMVGLEIGREEYLLPKLNINLSIDGTDAVGKFKRLEEALKKICDQQISQQIKKETEKEIIQPFSPFPRDSKFYFGYPFKFEAGGMIE